MGGESCPEIVSAERRGGSGGEGIRSRWRRQPERKRFQAQTGPDPRFRASLVRVTLQGRPPLTVQDACRGFADRGGKRPRSSGRGTSPRPLLPNPADRPPRLCGPARSSRRGSRILRKTNLETGVGTGGHNFYERNPAVRWASRRTPHLRAVPQRRRTRLGRFLRNKPTVNWAGVRIGPSSDLRASSLAWLRNI